MKESLRIAPYDFMSRSLMIYLALSTINQEPQSSGYSLIKIIKTRTKGLIELKVGTIYALLDVLVDQRHLIRDEIEIKKKTKKGFKRITVFTITETGLKELEALTKEWGKFILKIKKFSEEKHND
ncbi:MAG: PadR family transcriptional regulator [Candidatus Heimdallarchaeota archaeon]|nr:PadR family transcriptional regulator [Candidatus Heimdallarchaeota archaeon]